MQEKLVFQSDNNNLINQVCIVLKNNNIPFIKREEGAGSYISITMGSSLNLKEIYVSEEDYENAKSLIENIEDLFNNNSEETDNIENQEMNEDIKKYNKIKYVTLIPILFFVILFIVAIINIFS